MVVDARGRGMTDFQAEDENRSEGAEWRATFRR
jgi:hypothetical protein